MNIRIGRISHLLKPGYSWCNRCKTNWGFVEGHSTDYIDDFDTWLRKGGGSGLSALCEKCWAELTPEQRLPYYRKLVAWWHRDWSHITKMSFDEEWALVEAAVRKGR